MAVEFYIRQNDTLPVIQHQLKDRSGAVDLSTATGVEFHMFSQSGTSLVDAAGTIITDRTFTAADSVLTTNSAHNRKAGDDVMVKTSGTLPTGLYGSTRYYVVNPTPTTLQLATTKGGTPITLSSAGTGTHTLIAGEVRYSWTAANTATNGRHNAEWEVTFTGGAVETFPNNEENKLVVIVYNDLA